MRMKKPTKDQLVRIIITSAAEKIDEMDLDEILDETTYAELLNDKDLMKFAEDRKNRLTIGIRQFLEGD